MERLESESAKLQDKKLLKVGCGMGYGRRDFIKRGGRVTISHFYRKPSWMWTVHRLGRENIEYENEDPPVNEFSTEAEVEAMFSNFEVEQTFRDHHRAWPAIRIG